MSTRLSHKSNVPQRAPSFVAMAPMVADLDYVEGVAYTDVVSEVTAGAGVTIDSVLLKDGQVQGTAPIKADTISEMTPAAGVTVDGVKLKDGAVYSDQFVYAVVTVANSAPGVDTVALTMQLYQDAACTVPIASSRFVKVRGSSNQYSETPNAHAAYSAATVGTIAGSGGGELAAVTNATGAFACTVTNTTDETLYFFGMTQPGGVDDLTKACVVIGSNNDAAIWSA